MPIGKQVIVERRVVWAAKKTESKEKCMPVQTMPQSDLSEPQPNTAARENDWTKPAALAIPKEGYFKPEQGRYGPVYPKTPANYGFTIIAKIKPVPE